MDEHGCVTCSQYTDTQIALVHREMDVRFAEKQRAVDLVADNTKAYADQRSTANRALIGVLGVVLTAFEIVLRLIWK